MSPKKKGKRGPKPDRVKIDEGWEEAVRKALKKRRPKDGWPDPGNGREPPNTKDDSESSI